MMLKLSMPLLSERYNHLCLLLKEFLSISTGIWSSLFEFKIIINLPEFFNWVIVINITLLSKLSFLWYLWRLAKGSKIRNSTCFTVNIAIIVTKIRRSSIRSWSRIYIFRRFLLKLNHSVLFVKNSLSKAMWFCEGIMASIT